MVKEFLKFYKGKVTGVITNEIREKGERIGFYVEDIVSNKKKVFARIGFNGPKVSKYGVDIKTFEEIAIPSLKREADLYIIDEIGRMELYSKKFENLVLEILTSNKDVLATLHRKYIEKYKKFGDVIWLEKKYWNKTFKKILKEFGLVE